jgi:hypothetical protein
MRIPLVGFFVSNPQPTVMANMNPEQFKRLLTDTRQAENINVSGDVQYLRDDEHQLNGNVQIINCNLPLLSIASKTLESLTITGGKVWQLKLETESSYDTVTVKNCIMDYFVFDETSINSLSIFPAANNRPRVESGFTSTRATTILLEGNYKSLKLIEVGTSSVHLKKVIIDTIETLRFAKANLLFENVKVNNARFHFFDDTMLIFQAPDGLKYFTNVPDVD